VSTGPEEPPEDWEDDDGPTEPDWDLYNDALREDRELMRKEGS
jgi:hypothetical protein